MTAIAFTYNNRPDYMHEVLQSWAAATAFAAEHRPEAVPSLAVIRSEPPHREIEGVWEAMVSIWGTCFQSLNAEVLGPLVNPFRVIDEALTMEESVIYAEDDSPVSKDALIIAWEMRQADPMAVGCLNHRWLHQLDPEPGAIVRTDYFNPAVFTLTYAGWRKYLRETWDHDYSHRGWDWNINDHVIPEQGLKILMPSLSRSTHIGRHGGAHTTEENWHTGLAHTFSLDHAEAHPVVRDLSKIRR